MLPQRGRSCRLSPATLNFPLPGFIFLWSQMGIWSRELSKVKTTPEGGKNAVVSFNLDQFCRPAACADKWEQDGLVPTFLNGVMEGKGKAE